MINKLNTVYKKTIELENQVKSISISKNDIKESTNCVTFSKQLLNLSVKVSKKILLAEFEVVSGANLYFQNQIELNLIQDHKVRFTLIVNGIYVYRSNKTLSSGYNNITIMKAYTALLTEKVEVYLLIEPEFGKEVILTGETLAVWGISKKNSVSKFKTAESNENYVLGYINNQVLYYLFAEKKYDGFTSDDFLMWGNAKDFSFVHDTQNNCYVLFVVDNQLNLFAVNFQTKERTFIESHVTSVSASTNNNIIFVSFVQNGTIKYFEYKEHAIPKKLERISTKFVDCYSYFNQHNNTFYIIGTDSYSSNYLFESVNENQSKSCEISVSFLFNIKTYGVNNEL